MSRDNPSSGLPPSYIARDALHDSAPVDPELPVYTPPPSRRPPMTPAASQLSREERIKEFEYDIKRRGRTIASMTILADGSYSKHLPTFVEGLPIKGRVYISLPKAEVLQSVVLSVSLILLERESHLADELFNRSRS